MITVVNAIDPDIIDTTVVMSTEETVLTIVSGEAAGGLTVTVSV